MQKKVLYVLVIALMLFAFAGCSKVVEGVKQTVEDARQVLTGSVSGEIGKSYSTKWFDFTVKSVKDANNYAGYEADSGNRLIVVLISETGAWDDPIPMGTYDFYLDADSFYDYNWPLDPYDDSMMPMDFYLTNGETVEYYMIYEIPSDAPNLKLLYTEIDEEENLGTTFSIDLGFLNLNSSS